jgi:D-serine deaminase-like pyridoxal phosphate-dependent protein
MTALSTALELTAGIDTPFAAVDEPVRERNLARMQALATRLGLHLRPHAKTHKSVFVARRQIALGAAGLTVATLMEAEVFADAGADDLLLAHLPVGTAKLSRLAELAGRVRRLAVAVDSLTVAITLPPEVDVLWEVDTGLHRLGTTPGMPTVREVQRLVDAIGPQRFRGLMTHGGHAYRASDDAELLAATRGETGGLVDTAEMLRASGIEVRELSIGSTPTTLHLDQVPGATEMRPGTYVYGDATQVRLGSHAVADCALAVVATVVSTPEAGRAVVDAGSKALSADLRITGTNGYGIVLGHPSLLVERLSEEHAVLTSTTPTGLSIGDRLAIIPTHVCTVVNLHGALVVIQESGATRWEAVEARGWRRA